MLRFVWLLVFAAAAPAAFAASTVRLSRAVTVYSKPDFESKVAFTLREGATISVGNATIKGFKKIRATVAGQNRLGYVPVGDFEFHKDLGTHGWWGAGGGFMYSRLSQASKSFSTSDDVAYTLDEYTSSTFNFLGMAQFGAKNFWRGYLAMRSVDFKSKATLNLNGAPQQDVSVAYKFISVGGQRGWGMFTDWSYIGAGVEFAKSLSNRAKLGTQDLSDKTKAPDYLYVFAMGGANYKISDHWSAFAELRLGAVGNQSPMVTVIEVVSSVIYWP